MRKRAAASTAIAATALFAFSLYAPAAAAHAIGLSSGEYTAKGSSVVAKLAFARGEVAQLAPSIDGNRDGHLTASEVDAARSTLKDQVLARIEVTSGGASCTPTITDAGLTEHDGLLLT